MHQLYRPQPGTPLEDLDTPCLILDLDALDRNMGVMADYYEGQSSKLRGHSKNHKTPRWRCGKSEGVAPSAESAPPK